MKVHQIRTRVSTDTTIKNIERVLSQLGIPKESYRLILDAYSSKAGVLIKHHDVHYSIVSEQQTDSKKKPSLQNNIRAVYHLLHSRELNIRKGVETIESAFGGYVDWLTTPKLPFHVEEAFKARGYTPELPKPKEQLSFGG